MNLTRELLLYWLPYSVCIAIVVGSVYYVWKSIYADRSQGRRRCPRCWYDMAYTEGLTCSECGHTSPSEASFNGTRRHWTRAIVGLVVCVTTILGMYWQAADRGIASSLPTPMLIMAMPFVSDGNSAVFKQISRRMALGELTDAQRKKVLMRCAVGDWSAAPPTDAWIQKYGSFIQSQRTRLRGARQGTSLHELELPLLDIPPRVFFDTREHWLSGDPARIRVRAQDWWPEDHECKIRITSLDDPSDTRTIVRRPTRNGPNAYVLMTRTLDPSITSVGYEVEVFRRRNDITDDWVSVETSTVILPLTVRDSLEEAIAGVSSEAMTDVMKTMFGGVTKWTGGPQPVRFQVRPNLTFVADFDSTAIGISVELLHKGVVARQLDLWWLAGENAGLNRGYEHDVPFEDYDLLMSLEPEDLESDWSLRVRSDPNLALLAGNAPQYWKGEFTVDITLNQVSNPVQPKPPNAWMEIDETQAVDEDFVIDG